MLSYDEWTEQVGLPDSIDAGIEDNCLVDWLNTEYNDYVADQQDHAYEQYKDSRLEVN